MPPAPRSAATRLDLRADLLARFAVALAKLRAGPSGEGGAVGEGQRIGLAVSGGGDSMAMLLLAHAAIPGEFEVASVDHGLRPAAATECAAVMHACEERGIASAVLRVQVAPGNLQAEARASRYAALAKWAGARGLAALCTAHHADDQAETLLMRLNRGSGVSGLAGVRERGVVPGSDLPLLRPLLAFRRADLAAMLHATGLSPAQDPSNADLRFDRVRLRQALAGSVPAASWLDPAAMAASAAHLADAAEALQWAARREWAEQVTATAHEIRYSPAAPRAVALLILERAINQLGGSPRGGEIARLLDRLASGHAGTLAGVIACPEGPHWLLRREPPRKPPRKPPRNV